MAIAFDAASAGSAGSGTSGSFTSNTVTGTNTIGVVICAINSTAQTATATWNSVAMTATASSPLTVGTNRLYFFYLVNPASASTVALSFSGSVSWWAASASYTGVSQTAPVDQEGTATTTTTSLSKTLTSTIDNCWGVTVFHDQDNTNAITAGAGTTKRTSTGNGFGIADTNAATTPPGNITLNLTAGAGAETRGMVMITMSPPVAATTQRLPYLNLLGVGQ